VADEINKQNWMQELEQFEPNVFWEKHGRRIIWGSVAVLAALVAAFLWQRERGAAEERAAFELATAGDIESLQRAIQQNAGKEATAPALLRLGDLQYRQQRYAEAATSYRQLLSSFPRHAGADGARLGLAAIDEAQGNLDAARAQYQQLSASPNSYTALPARMGLARCTELAGQYKEARQLYEEVIAAGQRSPWQHEAMVRWTILSRQLPAVESTPAASTPAPGALPLP